MRAYFVIYLLFYLFIYYFFVFIHYISNLVEKKSSGAHFRVGLIRLLHTLRSI
jgi:hypothetical protein